MVEVAVQDRAGELGERAGELDAGGPAADHDDRHGGLALHRVGLGLGALEGQEDATPDRERVIEGLEPRGELLPLRMAEVAGAAAGGDDEIVVGQLAAGVHDPAAGQVEGGDLGHDDREIGPLAEERADRLGDVDRGEPGGGDLVEERLKQVVVLPIDDRDPREVRRKMLAERQPAETGADHDDMGQFSRRSGGHAGNLERSAKIATDPGSAPRAGGGVEICCSPRAEGRYSFRPAHERPG